MALLPKVKLKAMLSFPSSVIDGAGVDVTRVNGAFKLDLAFDDFAPPVSGVPDAAHQNALLWNSVTGTYVLAPITILGSGGAVPEAPNDGVQYGRQSLNWTPISTASTVPPATVPPLMDGTAAVGSVAKYAKEDHVHPTDTSRAASSHSHTAANVTDFSEAVDDRVAGLLQAGSNITLTYDDPGNTLTVASTVSDGDKGDITVSLSGVQWTIDANAVSNAKLAQMPVFTIKANNTGVAAFPTDINIASLTSKTPAAADYLLLSDTTASGALKKTLISALPGGTSIGEAPLDGALYSRQGSTGSWAVAGSFPDGDKGDITITSSGTVWTVDADAVTFAKIQNIATDSLIGRDTAGTGDPENITLGTSLSMSGAQVLRREALTGDVTATVDSNATTIANGVVSLAKMANLTAPVFVGRTTAGAGVPEALTPTQATAMLDVFAASLKGLVPSPAGATTTFLRADGTWAAAQPLDAELTAIAGLTSAANQVPMFTGSGTASTITVTPAAQTVLDDTSIAAMLTTLGIRERLTANRTYYVRGDGNDSNTGLVNSSVGAYATPTKAYSTILTLDLNGFNATIMLVGGAGNITNGLVVTNIPVGGNVFIDGTSSPIWSVTSANCLWVSCFTSIGVSNIELRTITSGNCLFATGGGNIVMRSGITFGASVGNHMYVQNNGIININNSYTVSGAAVVHHRAELGGIISLSGGLTVTNSGTNAFTFWAYALGGGAIQSASNTYTGGTITGTRYLVELNGTINTFGAGANYFPGNAAGSTATGGQYV